MSFFLVFVVLSWEFRRNFVKKKKERLVKSMKKGNKFLLVLFLSFVSTPPPHPTNKPYDGDVMMRAVKVRTGNIMFAFFSCSFFVSRHNFTSTLNRKFTIKLRLIGIDRILYDVYSFNICSYWSYFIVLVHNAVIDF